MYHKNLEIWKLSIRFVKDIYKITNQFPKSEIYGLTNQIRRAAVSIPSNLAEGNARFSNKDTLRFFDIMIGSIAEVDTQLLITCKIGFINSEQLKILQADLNKINAMAIGLRKSIQNNTANSAQD